MHASDQANRNHARTRWIYLVPGCLGLVLSLFVSWRHHVDMDTAAWNYRTESQDQAAVVADRVENTLRMMYQGLRTISRLPGIRAIERCAEDVEFHGGGAGLDRDARQAVREIYNNLASNVAVSELYIVPVDLEPDEIDPCTGEPQAPITTFDELIVGRYADGTGDEHGDADDETELEEVEIHEYRLMKRQLAWMRHTVPRIEDISELDLPAIGGPEVVTCDNSRYSPRRPDDSDRSGLVYSVPFYGPDGALKGCISGVILTHALRDLLPSGRYALRNLDHDYFVDPRQDGQWQASREFALRAEPDTGLLYSEVLALTVRDGGGTWALWVGAPDAAYWARADVKSARHAAAIGYAGAACVTVGLGMGTWMVRRNRRLIEAKNAALEERSAALAASEARQRAIVDGAADGVITIDDRGIIQSFNAAAQRMFGYSPDEAIGRNVTRLMPPPYRERHNAPLARYLRTGEAKIMGAGRDIRAQRSDGTSFPVELSVSEVSLGERRLFTGIVRDITERNRVQAELRRAKEAAEAANRTKSDFLANMSHELRTPLHGILSFAGFGIKKHPTAEPEKLHRYFRQIQQSGQTLLALLNNLLDLAKLEAGKTAFNCRPENLAAHVACVVDEFAALASDKQVSIRCAEPDVEVVIPLDAEKIKQVVRNLLSNAVKFSPEGGHVEVCIRRQERAVAVSVCDQGPGIPENELGTVFDKFAQSSKTKTGAGGTGLGLSICRQIVAAHDGCIWAENDPRGGATFCFELPTSAGGENAQDSSSVQAERPKAGLTTDAPAPGADGQRETEHAITTSYPDRG